MPRAMLICALVALVVSAAGGCGTRPLPSPPRGVDDLQAPAPREIIFAGAYENRRSEPYAPLVRLSSVTALNEGGFFLADYGGGRVHVFDDQGYYVSDVDEFAGGVSPLSVEAFGFHVLMLDGASRQILRYRDDGVFRDVFLPIDALDSVQRIEPAAMDVDADDGRIAICDVAGHRVLVTGPFLDLDTEIGEYGSFSGQFNEPRGVAFGLHGVLYVSDRGNRRVQVFDRAGQVMLSSPGINDVEPLFDAPSGLDVDRWGNVYVTDTVRGVVVVLAPDLYPLAVLGGDDFADDDLVSPIDCAVGPDDRLYVADAGVQALPVYDLVFP